MNKMVFVLNEDKILKDDKINIVKLRAFLDVTLISNNFEKESENNDTLIYRSLKNEDCFEDLLKIYLLLFKQAWLKDCLSDWYLLSDEENKDGILVRQEVLNSQFARW